MDVVWARAQLRLTVMKTAAPESTDLMRSESTVRTAVVLAVTGDIVGIIAQADMCTLPACSVRRPAQAETADLTDHQNV
jgi:hypothetical protein